MTKGGERCRLKACCSALSAQIRWNRFPDLGGTSFGVFQYLLCQANSVAPSFQNRWHRFWLLDATGPCNKFTLAALYTQIRWNRFPDLGGTGFGVFQYLFCQANSVAPSFQNRWHRFWLLDATCPCNKFTLASFGLENLCYVC
jgi:hypothetical protein